MDFIFYPNHKNIFTPVIRQEVRQLQPVNNGHYTVYLPAYGDEQIIRVLSCFPEIEWQVFSKHSTEAYTIDHITVRPVQNDLFLQSLATAEGVLCGAGFETPAEVLYLGKKLLVIPMKGQYEQQCNAAALRALGVTVLKNLKVKQVEKIRAWLIDDTLIPVSFPDETDDVLDIVLDKFFHERKPLKLKQKPIESPSAFRELVLRKIFSQLKT
jgi:uncharacterized protein (TIGR00661 family)